MSKNDIISKEEEPTYAYGAEVALLYLTFAITFIGIGFITGQLLYGIIFSVFFIGLRSCAGGYHASTRLRCFIISVGIYVFVLSCISWIPQTIKYISFLPMLISSNCVLILTAPTQNLINPKTDAEMSANKNKMYIWLFIINAASVLSWVTRFGDVIFFVLAETLTATAVLSVLNLYKNYTFRRDSY